MRTIGIRVEPSAITFVIFDSIENSIKNIEQIKIPTALNAPQKLKYIRVNILDILREYAVDQAGIRITESNSQTLKIERIQIEGVILETLASSLIKKYFCGQISTISKLLHFERNRFKEYVEGSLTYSGIENWNSLNKIEREACLTALGAVHA